MPLQRKIRYGMVGGGPGAFIGGVHRKAAALDGGPKIAAQLAADVAYVSPVEGAKEELLKIDPKLANNQLVFPDEATRAKLHPFPNLNEDEERQMNEAMQQVVGA